MDLVHLLAEFDGRIRRKHFWLGLFVIIIVGSLAMIGLKDRYAPHVIQLIVMALMLYPCCALFAKRLHDRDKSAPFWLIVFFGPYVVFIVMQGLGVGFTEYSIQDQIILVPNSLFGYVISTIASSVGFWALIDLGLLAGTIGPNDFGPDPKIIG